MRSANEILDKYVDLKFLSGNYTRNCITIAMEEYKNQFVNSYEADRDRWRARCEAAENYINIIFPRAEYEDGKIIAAVLHPDTEEYDIWQKIKSEMEAE